MARVRGAFIDDIELLWCKRLFEPRPHALDYRDFFQ
jgi:hypothetical protein